MGLSLRRSAEVGWDADHVADEDEAVQLMAERENLTHLLPLPPFGTRESALRRVIRRLGIGRAA